MIELVPFVLSAIVPLLISRWVVQSNEKIMIQLRYSFLLLACFLKFGTANAATGTFWIDPKIPQLIRMPHVLTMPRPPLYVSSPARLNTCKSYLTAKPLWNIETSYRVLSQYNVYDYFMCEALAWAKVNEIAGAGDRNEFGKALCKNLDMTSFVHSNSAAFLNAEFDSQQTVINLEIAGMGDPDSQGNRCVISNRERHFEMRAVLHVTDLNTQRRLLWVWITDDMLGGRFRARYTEWFEWSPKAQRWKATKELPQP